MTDRHEERTRESGEQKKKETKEKDEDAIKREKENEERGRTSFDGGAFSILGVDLLADFCALLVAVVLSSFSCA